MILVIASPTKSSFYTYSDSKNWQNVFDFFIHFLFSQQLHNVQ
jgi:hypothetical protein